MFGAAHLSAANLRAWGLLGKMLHLQPMSRPSDSSCTSCPQDNGCVLHVSGGYSQCIQMPVSCETQSSCSEKMYHVESGLKSCCCMNGLPNGHIFSAWFPTSGTILEGSGNSRRWDQAGGCRPLEIEPWLSCTWAFHLSLFCKQLSFTCVHSHYVCPKYIGTDNHGLNSL